jgi:hypothetical protein
VTTPVIRHSYYSASDKNQTYSFYASIEYNELKYLITGIWIIRIINYSTIVLYFTLTIN